MTSASGFVGVSPSDKSSTRSPQNGIASFPLVPPPRSIPHAQLWPNGNQKSAKAWRASLEGEQVNYNADQIWIFFRNSEDIVRMKLQQCCFFLYIRLRTSGRWDTSLLAPSKTKGLSIGFDVLFWNHIFFGSKLKAPCTYSTSTRSSKPLESAWFRFQVFLTELPRLV